MSHLLDREALIEIATGACLLGSGGGGPLGPGLDLLAAISDHAQVERISVADALALAGAPGDFPVAPSELRARSTPFGSPIAEPPTAACVAWAGLPSAARNDNALDPTLGLGDALARLEAHVGGAVDTLMPVEVGALNAIAPALLAIERQRQGRPTRVIDGDWAGRSVPSFEMLTLSHPSPRPESTGMGFRRRPVVLASTGGETVLLELDSISDLESMLSATVGLSNFAGLAGIVWPIYRQDLLGSHPIEGSLDLAQRVGRCSIGKSLPCGEVDPIVRVLEVPELVERGARELFRGYLESSSSATHGGRIDAGELELTNQRRQQLRMVFHNETLLAYFKMPDGTSEILAQAPETIGCHAHGHGPFSNAVDPRLLQLWSQERRPISVLGLGCPAPLTDPNHPSHRAFHSYLAKLGGAQPG